MRCVLVSCCGLPAAGKTTFCRSVVSKSTTTSAVTKTSATAAAADSHLKNDAVGEKGPQIRVSHVCFDEHIDRARQRQRRRCEGTASSSIHQQQLKQEEEQGEEESEFGLERRDYRRGGGERDGGTDKRHTYGKSTGDTDMIGATHRSEDDSIEAPRVTDTAQCAGLREAASSPEGSGKDGARWWHEGRRAALAEIEHFAAQAQEMATPSCKAPPVNTASSMTVSTVPLASKRRGTSRKKEPIHEGVCPTSTVSPASTVAAAETGCSVDSTEEPRHELADSAAAIAMAEAMMAVSPEQQNNYLSEEKSAIHLVLADDNMHFRSMRHEVFRLARAYGCSYAQVYFPIDVEVAVERNIARSTPVSEAVIRKMALSIQAPDPERFKWEQHTAVVVPQRGFCFLQAASIIVSPTEGDPLQPGRRSLCGSKDALDKVDEASREKGAPDEAGAPDSFWHTIAAAAAEYPVLPVSSDCSSAILLEQVVRLFQRSSTVEGERFGEEADRLVTRSSLLHQFDLDLRESVKRVAETATCSGLARDVLRTVMRACSASRKEAMRRLRANGLNSSARKVDMNTAGFRAASQTEGGEDGIGVAEERSGSGAAVAEGALARRTVCAVAATGGNILASTQPCELPHIEQFVSRLEEGLRTIDGVGQDARENLVNVARGPAARKGFAEMFA